jgi:hypothetical protein
MSYDDDGYPTGRAWDCVVDDQLLTGEQLRHKQGHIDLLYRQVRALEGALTQTREERDRARGIAVALEQELAAGEDHECHCDPDLPCGKHYLPRVRPTEQRPRAAQSVGWDGDGYPWSVPT